MSSIAGSAPSWGFLDYGPHPGRATLYICGIEKALLDEARLAVAVRGGGVDPPRQGQIDAWLGDGGIAPSRGSIP